jgi:hypothetical protein
MGMSIASGKTVESKKICSGRNHVADRPQICQAVLKSSTECEPPGPWACPR